MKPAAPAVSVAGKSARNAAKAVIFEERFTDGWALPAGWTTSDGNGDGRNWQAMYGVTATDDGSHCVVSESYLPGPFGGAYDPDNWLITPQISIPSEGIHRLSYAIGYSSMQSPENHYEVLVSATGTDLADFEMSHEETVHLSPGASF